MFHVKWAVLLSCLFTKMKKKHFKLWMVSKNKIFCC